MSDVKVRTNEEQANVNEVTKPETKPVAEKATTKPKATKKSAFSQTKIKQIAQRSWWRKASKKKIASEFNLTEEQLDELRASRAYKNAVSSLMLSQWPDLGSFDKWVKSYGKTFGNFAKRMGIEFKTANALVIETRKQHELIANGKRKAPRPVQNPHKKA